MAEFAERGQAAVDADSEAEFGLVQSVSGELAPASFGASFLDIAGCGERFPRVVGVTDREVEDRENGIADDFVQETILPPYGRSALVVEEVQKPARSPSAPSPGQASCSHGCPRTGL
jgi:hypothetical protein